MKKLSQEEIARLAKMTYLELSEEFLQASKDSLNNIINWVEELKAVDTSNVEPMFTVADLLQQHIVDWREDKAVPTEGKDAVLTNATDVEYGFFAVPKVIE